MRNRLSAEMLLLAAGELRGFAWVRGWAAWLLFPFARREMRRWSETSITLQSSLRPQRRPRLVRPVSFAAAMAVGLAFVLVSAVAIVGVVQAQQRRQPQFINTGLSPEREPETRRLD